MSRLLFRALLLAGLFLPGFGAASCAPAAPRAAGESLAPTVLLVSLDGFRWDYLDRYETPQLRRLAREGVHAAQGMTVVFPTKTFPSHYTLVTGLHAENHGIISNTMYDPEWDAWFRIKDRSALEDERWWGGEPIWVTAEKQGKKTATFFWVGSEASIRGIRPTYWKRFDTAIPAARRVDQVLRWLDLPREERPAFVTLYFGEVDSAGHLYGPDSPQTARAVQRVDAHVGRLVEGLRERALLDRVNLIVVSDHGMTGTSPERVIYLEDHVDPGDALVVDTSPVLMLWPRGDRLEAVHRALAEAHPRLAVYRREELPDRWHFRNHRRIPPLIGVAEEGWIVLRRREDLDPKGFPRGMHGYDNRLPSMRALFVARGPAFARGLAAEPFESVQLYGLLAEILGVEAAPNDGDPQALRHMLQPLAQPQAAAGSP